MLVVSKYYLLFVNHDEMNLFIFSSFVILNKNVFKEVLNITFLMSLHE